MIVKADEKLEEVIKKKLRNVASDSTVDAQAETAEGVGVVINF